ncbi:MAG: hypothetical protein LBH80_05530 [Prevotellaceae bacterium]|nr:hypothetical protein [Prevotellaceae bacterium]
MKHIIIRTGIVCLRKQAVPLHVKAGQGMKFISCFFFSQRNAFPAFIWRITSFYVCLQPNHQSKI